MSVDRPVILLGTGRSGSTAMHRLLSEHPHFMWLSDLCNRRPDRPEWNRALVSALEYPVIGPLLRRKIAPGECYLFWQRYARGFRRSFRDLVAGDVTEREKREVRAVFERMLSQRKNRLLLKITGWPRMGFLREIFPDVKFVHIVRDGRAVVNSLLAVNFWEGWHGPSRWRWGELPLPYRELFERENRSFVVLAAIQWMLTMDAVERTKGEVPAENFKEITYSDFCARTEESIRAIVDFAGVEWNAEYEKRVRAFRTRNENDRWKEDLTPEQQRILGNVLGSHLAKYGFL